MATPSRHPKPSATPPSGARLIALTSGKGGVGKTLLSANLAAALARRGERVLVIDADLGLANLDVVLNLQGGPTLHDVFTGSLPWQQALRSAPGEFDVLLAGSGLVEYSRLSAEVREQFTLLLAAVRPRYDRVLIDTGAGLSDIVLYAVSLADDVIVVTTPEPTALADAYATCKVLALQQRRRQLLVLVNQAQRAGEGRHITTQLQKVLDRFVPLPPGETLVLHSLGDLPLDPWVRQAVQRRQLLLQCFPGCEAALALQSVVNRLVALLPRYSAGYATDT